MKTKKIFTILIAAAVLALVIGIGVGSVYIPAPDIFKILAKTLFGTEFQVVPDKNIEAIFLNIRLPRALLAFIVGAALSVSGVIVQSILRNPLASSYTLGISSGAVVGASLAILFGFSFLGLYTIPFFGIVFGLLTVFLAIFIACRIDQNMMSTTIILTGMALSMFASSITSFLMSVSKESAQRIIFWQMGSFSMKDWIHPIMLFPITLIGILIALFFSKEMDLMTFGEEQAKAAGVDVIKIKWILLGIGAILTGFAVSLVGVIGFVDLFTPHVARKLLGAKHRVVIPAAAIMGGIFMILCDLIARTITSPAELPVGAVTSFIGAPFFIYLYFDKGRGMKHVKRKKR